MRGGIDSVGASIGITRWWERAAVGAGHCWGLRWVGASIGRGIGIGGCCGGGTGGDCGGGIGGQPASTRAPAMTSDTLAPRYSKSAERPVRSCPVVCTMISAGIAHASVSHAPGRKPAAVGASGSEEMEKSLYMAMWPVLSEGCMPRRAGARVRAVHLG